MKAILKSRLKSHQGFTIQDLAIAIVILILFSSVMASTYMAILNTQTETKLDAVLTLYAVEILEYIDEIDYASLENPNQVIALARNNLQIPSGVAINLEITPYESEENNEDIIKTVKVIVGYTLQENQHQITMTNIKVREV